MKDIWIEYDQVRTAYSKNNAFIITFCEMVINIQHLINTWCVNAVWRFNEVLLKCVNEVVCLILV